MSKYLIKVIFPVVLFSVFIPGLLCQGKKLKLIEDKANIRLNPNFKSQIIYKVQLGTIVHLIKKTEEWYRVKLPPNDEGIVLSDFLHQASVQDVYEKVEEVE